MPGEEEGASGRKRSSPCDGFEIRHSPVSSGGRKSVYDRTLDKLRAGARSLLGEKSAGPDAQQRCAACSQVEEGCGRCSDCKKVLCSRCFRTCEKCGGEFCSVCSIVSYEERDDQIFCMDCDANYLINARKGHG